MNGKTSIGRRIKFAREAASWSQERLGALLSPPKSHVTISDIEAGRTVPSWEVVTQISEVLGKELEYFTEKACPECRRAYIYPELSNLEPERTYLVTSVESSGKFSAVPYPELENEDVARDLTEEAESLGGGGEDL